MVSFNVVVALAMAAVGVASDPRPNKTAWKAAQEQKAQEKAAAEAKEDKMAAVNKAVNLLKALTKDILKEGEEEAATYNKFACFCKDTTAEKSEAIRKGEDSHAALTSSIGELSSDRNNKDTEISGFENDIKEVEKDMDDDMKARKKTLAIYEKNLADLEPALSGLRGAIKALKDSKPSMLQMQSVSKSVQNALLLADALDLRSSHAKKAAMVFLQEPDNEVPMENYKFKSDGVIGTLEGLLADFTKVRDDLDKEETESVQTHKLYQQDKEADKRAHEHNLERAKKEKAQLTAEIGAASAELTTVAATLLDDKEYLMKLAKMCTDSAKTWDQRSSMRAAELATLKQATDVVVDTVAANTGAKTVRLAQTGATFHLVENLAASPTAMEAIEASVEADESGSAPSPSFLQRRLQKAHNPVDARSAVVDMLRGKGGSLKSTLLVALAGKISADPFAKVKVLIQELIERLLQEAANEANQKGWCDKATADAKLKRKNAAEEVRDLNSEMGELEASIEKLTMELQDLDDEITELDKARVEANTTRNEEREENNNAIEEANTGLTALNMVIQLLDRFYKTAKKSEVDLSLTQVDPMEDAPDAGFDIGEAYTGAQGEAGGILGMLDVMKSDFERTISETKKYEAKAEKDHLEFMTQTGMSKAEKESAESQKSSQKEYEETRLGQADESFHANARTMREAIKELIELKAACIDTGMSYEERVARREDEIEALKKAECIFEKFAEVGAENVADEC